MSHKKSGRIERKVSRIDDTGSDPSIIAIGPAPVGVQRARKVGFGAPRNMLMSGIPRTLRLRVGPRNRNQCRACGAHDTCEEGSGGAHPKSGSDPAGRHSRGNRSASPVGFLRSRAKIYQDRASRSRQYSE